MRVGIVGGSIAGCAAAVALRGAGHEVAVFERSRGALRDRGAGIAMPRATFEVFAGAGYLGADMPVVPLREIHWHVREDGRDEGRPVGVQPFPALAMNWAVVWRELRSRVPGEAFRAGREVLAVAPDAELTLDDGSRERFDAVVGADGYRSLVRTLLGSPAEPEYAGYVLWRGDLPWNGSGKVLEERAVTIAYPGGHGLFYLIPDAAGAGHRLNWGMYTAPPPGLTGGHALSLPPGSLDDGYVREIQRAADRVLPPGWAALVHATPREALHVQPIYDQTVPRYAGGRILLAGDAGGLARPHTGSGAVKAIQDAMALRRACLEEDSWEAVTVRYDTERRAFGNELVELGRSLGSHRVEAIPDMTRMSPEAFQRWLASSVGGRANPYDE